MGLCPAWLVTLLLLSAATWSEGGRVVVLPMPFTSHARYQIHVARALVKLGHEVWLTMPDYLVAKGVLDTSLFTVLEYTSTVGNVEEISLRGLRDHYFQGKFDDWVLLFDSMRHISDQLLRNDTFFQTIKNISPDLIVIDNLPFMSMFTVLPYRLGVPFAFVGSAFDPIRQRVPFSPAVTPIPLLPFTDRMTFFQRTCNTLLYLFLASYDHGVYQDAVARYAPEMPYIRMDMLSSRAEIWLVEKDHIIDYPNPSLPNVKFIGGTVTGPTKPLPPKFGSFMDGAEEGVVIVSFGSYVLNLPKDVSDKILQVLLQLPMKSVFRSNLTSPDPQKILTSTWLPQNDLLGYPNTKVFVSHCWKNGQYEALYHAVPIVATPMFADQPYSAERVRVKGFAEVLDLRTCTAEELETAIKIVAFEPRYRQAITKASHLFRELFGVPVDKAAWWLNHVMRHGGGYMRSAGQDIRLYQLMLLDVFLFLFVVVVVVAIAVYCLVKTTCRFLCKRSPKTKKD